jgi:histone deacetylase 11
MPCCHQASFSSNASSNFSDRPTFAHLYSVDLSEIKCPIVYTPEYNISFFGVEKLHPFDSKKWGRVYQFLTGKLTAYDIN